MIGNLKLTGIKSKSLSLKKKYQIIARVSRQFVADKKLLILCISTFSSLSASIAFAQMRAFEFLIDRAFTSSSILFLVLTAIFMVLSTLFRSAFDYINSLISAHFAGKLSFEIRSHTLNCWLRQDMASMSRRTEGESSYKINDSSAMVVSMCSVVYTQAPSNFVLALAYLSNTFYTNWQLAFAALVVTILALWPVNSVGKNVRAINLQLENIHIYTNQKIIEMVTHIRNIFAFQAEKTVETHLQDLLTTQRRLSLKSAYIIGRLGPMVDLIGGLAIAGTLLIAGTQIQGGTMTSGQFLSFTFSLILVYRPIKILVTLLIPLQAGIIGSEQIFDILDSKPSILDPVAPKPLESSQGMLVFDNVDFRYPNNDVEQQNMPALSGFSAIFTPGKKSALVGPSGGGKTTCFNLCMRLFDPDSGSVTLDGHALDTYRLVDVRSQFSLVSQEISLLSDTVLNNIAFGDPNPADFERARDAAKRAEALNFIEALPQGFDTIIGSGEHTLSGGQKQRLAIARALYRDRTILLLDEPTSSLDGPSARSIQRVMDELVTRGRTVIVIAHRLETVTNSDVIYVVENGRITESGTHDALLNSENRAYRNLWGQ